MKNVHVVLG